MNELVPLRGKIDELDEQLVKLLNERAKVALEIGAMKEKAGLPVYAPEREELLLQRIEKKNAGPLRHESLRAIYREIMSASLSLEKELKIGCSGERGGDAHLAALSKFGSSLQYVFLKQVRDVFLQVEKGKVDCGVVLVKSAQFGIEEETLECFAESRVVVLAEIALGEGERKDRFFVIGKTPNRPSGNDRCLVFLRLENPTHPYSDAIESFVRRSINLLDIEVTVSRGKKGDRFCFLEAAGHSNDLLSAALLEELKEKCLEVRVLGSYPNLAKSEPKAEPAKERKSEKGGESS